VGGGERGRGAGNVEEEEGVRGLRGEGEGQSQGGVLSLLMSLGMRGG